MSLDYKARSGGFLAFICISFPLGLIPSITGGDRDMKKLVLLAFGVLLLSGCKPSDEQFIKIAKEEVAQSLKDPSSAQFRNMRLVSNDSSADSESGGYVCGELNGKNSFGAYVGFERIYIHVLAEPRWIIPLLGLSYSTSDFLKVDDGDGLQSRLDKLKMFADKCE